MANQIVVSAGAKVRNLSGVLTGTSGVVSSVPLGAANGVATLDSGGKVPVSQLPSSVVTYLGTWNAATNTPTLANGTGDAGDMYICNVAGTVNFGAGPVVFVVGDWVLYGSGTWQKSSGQNGTVTSVAITESGDSLNITGSPITSSGTINIGFNGTNLQYVNGAGNLTTFPTLITSIGLSMPSAFNVANSPLTANGTIAVTGAGVASQYIRGDGTLADFPSSGGGGSSVSYYLNGGTNQGTIGGTTYYEMSKTADTGTGVDFTKTGDGFIVAFLTDANDPAQLNIPAGNWNYEIYASMSANGGTPQMYAELYKYDGTTFTLISTSSNEILYDGTNLNLYTFAMTVPATTLALTDRLAIKLYATNSGGKTTTVHTQDSHLCQVITTFSTGITALNGLTAQVQYFQTGTSGTDFNISSTTATHTFNLPTASAANRGALSSADWSIFNGKQAQLNGSGLVRASGTTITYDSSNYITLTSISATAPLVYNPSGGVMAIDKADGFLSGYVSATDWNTFNNKQATITLTTTGTSGAATLIGATLNIPNYAPDLSNYVDLTTAQTIGGTKTFTDATKNNGGIFLQNASSNSLAGYMNLGGLTNGVKFTSGGGISNSFTLPSSTGYTFTFPNATGTLALTSDLTGGTVTSVAMTVPTGLSISGSPITTSGTLGVTFAAGYSIPTDASQTTWDTAYTNRITSLTTTGSSGSASLVSNTLNIPTYTLAGLGGISLTSLSATTPLSYNNTTGAFSIQVANTSQSGYLSSTDWNTFNGKGTGTVTSVAALTLNTTGTDLSSSVATGTTTPVITLNVPTASASNRGALSSADWSTFNGKESVLTFSSPLVRTTNTISIPVATTSVNGYLSSTDWTTFNGKQGAITLTTTGTSGAATLVGTTLNIPQYSGGGTITLSAIGSTPNANGATLTGSALNLEPASASFGGVVTTGTQTFAGIKTFSNNIIGSSGMTIGGASISNAKVNILATSGVAQPGSATLGIYDSTNTVYGFDFGLEGVATGNLYLNRLVNSVRSQMIEFVRATGNVNFSNAVSINPSGAGILSLGVTTQYGAISSGGTNAPTLYLNGATRGSTGTAANNVVVLATDGDFYVMNSAAATYKLSVTSGGNIGIGLSGTTIGSKLQVNGNAAIGYSASTAAPTNGLAVSGNVSIGTNPTSPTDNLEIRTASTTTMSLHSTGTGSSGRAAFTLARLVSTSETGWQFLKDENDDFLFRSLASSIPTERMKLTSTGQITLTTGANVSAIAQTGYSLTGANAQSLLDLAGTWNTTGNPTAIKLNITNTASGSTSNLMDLQVGGVSQFIVDKTGAVTATSLIKSGGTSSQFLKADGSVDSNTYATSSSAVLLTGTQTITGNKTFNAGTYFEYGSFIKQGSISQGSGYTGLGACVNGLSIGLPSAIHDIIFPSATGYDYTFPSLTGTVAVMDTAGLLTTTSIKTGAPSGDTAQVWKLGTAYSGSGISQTHYVNVEVNGVIYALLASNVV